MYKRVTAYALLAAATAITPAMAQEGEPLSVGLSTWVGYGLLHLAEEKGFFEDAGVEVDLIEAADKPTAAAALTTGRMDGWATTVDTFIYYNAQEIGVEQVLAVDFSKGGEGLIVSDDINSVQDLAGQTLGAEEGSSPYFLLLNILAENGMSIDDVDLQTMRAGDAGAAFAAGRLDAAATWDPWLSRAAEHNGKILTSSADEPGLIVDTVAFRSEVIDQRPDDVQAFIEGYFQAYDYWTENPGEANPVMAEALGMEAEDFESALDGIEFTSREQNREYIGTEESIGSIASVIDRGAAFYSDLGLIDQAVDASVIVDTQPLSAVLSQQ